MFPAFYIPIGVGTGIAILPTASSYRKLTVDWGIPGLVGTLAYQLIDVNDVTVVARTTAGIEELPAASGQYNVKVDRTILSRGAEVIWDDGVTTVTDWVDGTLPAASAVPAVQVSSEMINVTQL